MQETVFEMSCIGGAVYFLNAAKLQNKKLSFGTLYPHVINERFSFNLFILVFLVTNSHLKPCSIFCI